MPSATMAGKVTRSTFTGTSGAIRSSTDGSST